MNLLNDIKKFLKDDDEHVLKIEIAWDGITVYLDYDPGLEFREESIIPIHFKQLIDIKLILWRNLYECVDMQTFTGEVEG